MPLTVSASPAFITPNDARSASLTGLSGGRSREW
jgi:hypothetical protein